MSVSMHAYAEVAANPALKHVCPSDAASPAPPLLEYGNVDAKVECPSAFARVRAPK